MEQPAHLICPKCSNPMDEGTVGESEGIHYVSNRQTGFLKIMTRARWARVCMTCGFIELYLDPRDLLQKIGK